MMFPDDEVKLRSGRIDNYERARILEVLGEIASAKYDEYITQGGNAKGYNLSRLQGSLTYEIDVDNFDNVYQLDSGDPHLTKVANYFEYGTGIHNVQRAGQYRSGYIRPTVQEYLQFVAKDGKFIKTKKVKGVRPILAMEKAVKYVEYHRKRLQRQIRVRLQLGEDE